MTLQLSRWTSGMWNPWIQSWQASYSSITTALSSACARCHFLNDKRCVGGRLMCARDSRLSSCHLASVCLALAKHRAASVNPPHLTYSLSTVACSR